MKFKNYLYSVIAAIAITFAGLLSFGAPATAADMSLSPTPVSSTGTPVTGTSVSVNVGTWDAGTTLTYSWYRDTVLISGATTTSYTPVSADLATNLKFVVVATKAGFTTITKELTFGGPVVAPLSSAPIPTITGTFAIGSTLTAVPGTWDSGVSFSYQWKRAGGDITGANSSTYTTSSADAGYSLTVLVTGAKSGFAVTQRLSNTYSLSNGTLTLAPTPVITGLAQVGEFLSVSTGNWDQGVTFTYQWLKSGTTISGATNATYQIVSNDQYYTISVRVTGTKQGYTPVTWTTAATVTVKGPIPKVSWVYPSSPLTGKSTIYGYAAKAFGGTSNITKVCLTLDGKALTLPVGATGIQFFNESDYVQVVDYNSAGCYWTYSSTANYAKFRLYYDVTNWTLGSHTIAATATDSYYSDSLKSEMNFSVAYTGPVVTVNPLSSSTPVADNFTVSASATTHSSNAPIKVWCVSIDSQPITGSVSAVFKNASLINQDAVLNSGRYGAGCFDSTAAVDYRSLAITIDSKTLGNGNHSVQMRALSVDGATSWWSTWAFNSFSSKNVYTPTLEWGQGFIKPLPSGKSSVISTSISANIPQDPSLVVFSIQSGGSWVPFARISDSSYPSVKKVFVRNATIQVEVFDEDDQLVLTETNEVQVAPVITVGNPSVTVKNSTSGRAVKTLRYSAKTSPSIAGSCTAVWKLGSASGKTSFSFSKGKAGFSVNPSGKGSGTLSITCSGAGLTTSAPYVVKMRVP